MLFEMIIDVAIAMGVITPTTSDPYMIAKDAPFDPTFFDADTLGELTVAVGRDVRSMTMCQIIAGLA